MSGQYTPGQTFDEIGRRLYSLQKLARLEKKEFGATSERTARLIREKIAEAEAVITIDDIARNTTT